MQTGHYLPRSLPEALQSLTTLALDLRWNWHHGADDLWRAVDSELWEASENPWMILESVSSTRLAELAADKKFLQMLQQQVDARERHCQSTGWFHEQYPDGLTAQIAYFSMEFGLGESLPIYSGGLGVLAGDYLKTACDLDVPVIAVGLLYQQGYFRQAIDANREQLAFYPFNDPTMLPVSPLRDDNGEWIEIIIDLPGRPLRLRTWHAQVGRRSLLLLDSNDMMNHPGDRGITSELYGGGAEMRLQQEMVLGIGGWRLLERLGFDCPICHLNEGHAAFAILERARHYMARTTQNFDLALRATRAGNLFTTHTPVAAGFDRFSPDLFAYYFRDYSRDLGLSLDELMALGRAHADDASEHFNMAYLAVRGAGAVNGVSRLHGEVSQRIFQPLFPHWPQQQVPVSYVTNGVHVPTWDSAAADALWTETCGKSRWRGTLETVATDMRQLNDETLWQLRCESRQRLVGFLKNRLIRQYCSRGASAEEVAACTSVLDPDILTLGFARRFAEYKRPNLLLQDPERLIRLLCHRDRPVQLVFAGKAHPRDVQGKSLLREWQYFIERPEVRGRVVFVEDYDLVVAGQLTQGVDVWINTPRRPWEASGTSGMKVLVNGGLNLSELDGWWAEAYTPQVGWALGDGREHGDSAEWDRKEAEQLFQILENEVVPSFYQRNENGLPVAWIQRIRESMVSLCTQYTSNRMLREYVEQYYLPMAVSYHKRDAGLATELQNWHTQLVHHWQHIRFGDVTKNQNGAEYIFKVQVYLDDVPAEAVSVELYADANDHSKTYCQALQRGMLLAGSTNAYIYQGNVPADRPMTDYTPRIVAAHAAASVPLESGFILWHR